MHCRNCGLDIDPRASICVHCGVQVGKGNQFCQNCGQTSLPTDKMCMQCGHKLAGTGGKDFLTTLLLNIFLGTLGIHRFYTGNTGIALGQLFTLGGCGIWTIIDLILILTGDYKDGEGNSLNRGTY
jgi:TM2 domain-containing membrane protein YozV